MLVGAGRDAATCDPFPTESVCVTTKAKSIVGLALEQRRPLIIEDLDFQKKFAALNEATGANLARRLSSFSDNLFKAMLKSRAARFGVRVVEVNPAFTVRPR